MFLPDNKNGVGNFLKENDNRKIQTKFIKKKRKLVQSNKHKSTQPFSNYLIGIEPQKNGVYSTKTKKNLKI